MSDTEKLVILRQLIHTRTEMAEHTAKTAMEFASYCNESSSYRELYDTKLTAANAVSSFCYELLDILHALDLKED